MVLKLLENWTFAEPSQSLGFGERERKREIEAEKIAFGY
jgi:hypothetical protein